MIYEHTFVFRKYRRTRNNYHSPCSTFNIRRKKIPELMKGLGKGVKSFKDGIKDVDDEIKKDLND